MYDLTRVGGFDWDAGHSRKSADQHGVTRAEAEQVAFDERLLVLVDGRHSMDEMRYHALGRTDDGRQLQIAFTQRGEGRLIRVISVRDRSRKEGSRYAQEASVFKDEAEERLFWEKNDSADYLDWRKAERVRLPNLRRGTTAISLRLPLPLLERIKVAANKRDVPYQSLIKTWLAEKVDGVRARES